MGGGALAGSGVLTVADAIKSPWYYPLRGSGSDVATTIE
jgi:hypothetical protein